MGDRLDAGEVEMTVDVDDADPAVRRVDGASKRKLYTMSESFLGFP